MDKIHVIEGQEVDTGDVLGEVGTTGLTTGPHLHFEVRMESNSYFDTLNPELWLAPPQGWGVLAGKLLNTNGSDLTEQDVTVRNKETGQKWVVRSYGNQAVNSDPYYEEYLVLSDLPAGQYEIVIDYLEDRYKTDIGTFPGGSPTTMPLVTPTKTSTATPTNTPVRPTSTPGIPGSTISVSNISDNGPIVKYDKQEITFSVKTSASNPQLPYDPSAPSGVNGSSGVSVDAVFTSPSGKTWAQPGFYYQIFDDQVKDGSAWFYPTGQAVWKVRFSPDEVGTWKYFIKAQDKTGTSQSEARSFTVTASANRASQVI